MAMQAVLKVDAQQVLSKSNEMKNTRGILSNIMEQIKDRMNSIKNFWESEAATTYLTQFTKIHKDIEEMLRIVDEYTKDLDEVAQGYITAEQRVAQASSALPGDVFGV